MLEHKQYELYIGMSLMSTTLPLEVFTQRNFVADYSIKFKFY